MFFASWNVTSNYCWAFPPMTPSTCIDFSVYDEPHKLSIGRNESYAIQYSFTGLLGISKKFLAILFHWTQHRKLNTSVSMYFYLSKFSAKLLDLHY